MTAYCERLDGLRERRQEEDFEACRREGAGRKNREGGRQARREGSRACFREAGGEGGGEGRGQARQEGDPGSDVGSALPCRRLQAGGAREGLLPEALHLLAPRRRRR